MISDRAINTLPMMVLLARTLAREPGVSADAAPLAAGPIDGPLLVRLASHHLVTPALRPRFDGARLDPELDSYLTAVRELNRARNQRIRLQLKELVGVMNGIGIEPVLLKGAAHLAVGLYDDDADRVIGDIDILVAPEQRAPALAALIDFGYAPDDGEQEHDHHHHHPPMARHDSEAWVELHKAASRAHEAQATDALIGRARTIRGEMGSAAVPCPEDLLLQNIVHSQRDNGGFWSAEYSLRAAYDLILISRRFRDEIDWCQLASRIDVDTGRHRTGFYVRCAHRLFGQPLPPLPWSPIARLAERRWRLHAEGRMLWLQRTTRLMAHELTHLSDVIYQPAWRRHAVRSLLDPGWYRQHLRRVRTVAKGLEPR